MSRIPRAVATGFPHHITQRGNNRQDVFFADADRRAYLRMLKEESKKHGLEIHGYCLMTNHIHLIATPKTEESLAKTLGRTHFRYTRHINRRHKRSGHLWQNRFHSCALDESHYIAAMRYVERNPVRGGIAPTAWEYRWSSAAAHTGGRDTASLLALAQWREMFDTQTWKEKLSGAEDEETANKLRVKTRTGRPLGSAGFVRKLEAALGRRLRPLPHGRPKKRKGRKRVKRDKISAKKR